jgi:hypothetical protein
MVNSIKLFLSSYLFMNTEYYITPVPLLPSQCPVFVSRKYGQPTYHLTLAVTGILKMALSSRSCKVCRVTNGEIMDLLTTTESEDEFLDHEREVENTIVHNESGDEKTTPPSAWKCRLSPGTTYQWSDSACNPTVHKFDNTSARISADNITEEPSVLDYFELLLLPDMMNTIANETNSTHTS